MRHVVRAAALVALSSAPLVAEDFLRGDYNQSGRVDLADAAAILDFLFYDGTDHPCIAAMDTNGDASADIGDFVYLLQFLLRGGEPPPAPFPDAGAGRAEEQARCAEYAVRQRPAAAAALELGSGRKLLGRCALLPLSLDSSRDVQGLVAVFEAGDGVGIEGFVPEPIVAGADVWQFTPGFGFGVLAVLMNADNQPATGEVIPAGEDTLLGHLQVSCADTGAPVRFVEDRFAMVDGGPLLSNLVIMDGWASVEGAGLTLTDGELLCLPAPSSFSVEDGGNSPSRREGSARVSMFNNEGNAAGVETVVCHPEPLALLDVVPSDAIARAAFLERDIDQAIGGVLRVVLDPLDLSETLGPGSWHLATFGYRCLEVPDEGEPGLTSALTLCDGVIDESRNHMSLVEVGPCGGPVLREFGEAEGLILEHGVFTCEPVTPPLFQRSDSNSDGGVDVADAAYTLNWLFAGGPAPGCMAAADANGDRGVDVADPGFHLNFLFLGGPPPPAPHPDCGASREAEMSCDTPPRRCNEP